MMAEKIIFDVVMDKEIHEKLQDKTGIKVFNGNTLMMAVAKLLFLHDGQWAMIERLMDSIAKMEREKE